MVSYILTAWYYLGQDSVSEILNHPIALRTDRSPIVRGIHLQILILRSLMAPVLATWT